MKPIAQALLPLTLFVWFLACGQPQQPPELRDYQLVVGSEVIDFETQMMLLLAALEIYRIHMGAYPPSLDALIDPPTTGNDTEPRWRGPYVETDEAFYDPWERRILYRLEEDGTVTLKSLGPDGVESDDDLDASRMFPHWANEMRNITEMLPLLEAPSGG